MEFIKKAIKLGNSAGVVLPKKLLGSEVKITVINSPANVKKEALKLVDSYLEDLIGIYITNKSPIEVLAVSYETKKVIKKNNIRVLIVPLETIKKDLKGNSELRKKIESCEIILNKFLLKELKQGYNK